MLYITNKIERFSFISGCVVWVSKHLKEDKFIVFQLKTTLYRC